MNIDGMNVLFLTLDSCRFDTFLEARTPTFDKLGKVRRAGTHGTYTLPAHMSFFMGYLPSVNEPPYEQFYTPEVRQLWRLASGRPRPLDTVGLTIQAPTVPEEYARKGYKVIGSGGVRWFRHETLRHPFGDFRYYGETDSVFHPRKACEFPLAHSKDLAEAVQGERFFLFINCPETHVPYDYDGNSCSSRVWNVIDKYQGIWGCKASASQRMIVDRDEFAVLKRAQIAAVESVDRKVGALIADLPRPIFVVVAGDHGECFGEDDLWGHGFPHQKVTEVPLLMGLLR
ncbi:sulfatase-like hydrolase/transferase [Bradyrhizobium sp. BR 10261]|uniref:sulfatase-like hydrolase/transferase n=1 Tax=Bradyrhizobium sp. BR 10261 TaxID=2749992 RepID=UPI001C64A7D6|nr:sulfatase-like hydrolase/transferase [Bradyrhizobium sp. BR 10261]